MELNWVSEWLDKHEYVFLTPPYAHVHQTQHKSYITTPSLSMNDSFGQQYIHNFKVTVQTSMETTVFPYKPGLFYLSQ